MRRPRSRTLLAIGACAMLLIAGGAAATSPPPPTQAPSDQAKRGMSLLSSKGCVACHTTDGRKQVGPTFLGYYGSEIQVTTAGQPRTVNVDAEFVRRAIRTPNADLQAGFPANTMPTMNVSDDELTAMVAALEHLAAPSVVTKRKRDDGSILGLLIAVVLFILGHLIMSSTPVRTRMIGKLGANGFTGVYSLIILAVFVWIVIAYMNAPYVALWTPPLWTRWLPIMIMCPVLIAQVGSFTLKSPTRGDHKGADAAVGFARITRHPGQWSNAAWGLCHLPPNGDLAAVLIFGGLVALSTLGMLHIEARKRKEAAPDWLAYCEETSVIPFWAILRRKNRLAIEEIAVPLLVGMAVFVGFLYAHELVIGKSAWPY